MSNKRGNIFNEGKCLTAAELLAYAQGKLSGAEAHRAEKHLVDCEFCSEALEGIMKSGDLQGVPQHLDELNERIDTAVGKPSPVRVTHFSFRKIAAVIALLIVSGGLWVYIGRMNRSEKLFSQYYEPYHPAADSTAVVKPEPQVTSPPKAEPETKEKSSYQPIARTDTDKAMVKKEEKSIALENTKDEISVGQTSSDIVATVPAEKSPTQGALTKAPEDLVIKQNVSEEMSEVVAVDRSKKSGESLSKSNEAPTSAMSAMRETEFADVKVDASQLQRAPLQEAIHLYEAGVYEEAFKQAEKFLKKFPKDPEGLFYSGVSALSLKKEKVAAERLEDCLATGAQQWKEEASWYLSLCYVKLGRSSDARPLLEFLAWGSSEHAVEAKKMLESIH